MSQLKALLVGVWEVPSPASTRSSADAMKQLDDAIRQAEGLLARVPRVNDALKASGLAITLP